MKALAERNDRIGGIDPEQPVITVIQRYPATRAVFARHGLDTCCGGIHPVAMAAAAHGVDVRELLAELDEAIGRRAAPGESRVETLLRWLDTVVF